MDLPAILTADEDEQEILAAQWRDPLDPDDDHDVPTRLLLGRMQEFRERCKPHHLNWARAFLSGEKTSQIAEKHDVTYQTVHNALKKPKIQEFMSVLAKIQRIEAGPSLAARKNMLWNIAKREEEANPRTAIAAVDTLNKMEGDYRPEEEKGERGLVIQLQQFNFHGVQAQPHGDKIAQQPAQTLEGDFQPITIDTEATPTDD